MQTVFTICLVPVITVLFFSVIVTIRKKDRLSKYLANLMVTAIAAALSYILFFGNASQTWAYFFNGLYYALTGWMALQMLGIGVLITRGGMLPRRVLRVLLCITALDTLSCLLNVRLQHMFVLIWFEDTTQKVSGWLPQFRWAEYIHLFWCYVLACWTIHVLLKEGRRVPAILKVKFYAIVSLYLMLIGFNCFCYAQGRLFDYSVIMYGVYGIALCFFTIWFGPFVTTKELRAYTVEVTRRGICFADEDGECVYANDFARRFFAVSNGEYHVIADYIRQKEEQQRRKKLPIHEWTDERTVDGEKLYVSCTCENVLDRKGRFIALFLKIEDITDRVLFEEKKNFKKTHDPLTGLYNRSGFFSAVSAKLAAEPDEAYDMIVSNIEGFKLINTFYGTQFGDKVLQCQAALVRASQKEGNICGRLDADHFAMLLPRSRFHEEVFVRNVNVIRDLFTDYQYQIVYHVGVYAVEDLSEPVESMYNKAKMTVDEYRGDVTQVVVYYQGDYEEKLVREKRIRDAFDAALQNGEFVLYYQPQMTSAGTLKGAEALVRWNSSTQGLLFPDAFIGVLEKANLIYKLDRYVWNCAAMQLKKWKESGRDGLYLSINVSTNDFYHLDIFETLSEIVQSNGIDARDLHVEITETAILSRKEENLSMIDRLREHGFLVEIDDFGSGYSSLNMLKDIQADALKIDKAFIQDMDMGERNRKILRAIVHMAGELNMSIIAEGIEEKKMVDELLSYGCDCFQGYYYSKPLSITDFESKYMKDEKEIEG